MWKEQLVFLALVAALFPPASSQSHFEYEEIDDECHLKTSIVLEKLDNCEKKKSKDDFRRNQLLTDVVKETIVAVMKQQQEENKSQLDQLLNKHEKVNLQNQMMIHHLGQLQNDKANYFSIMGSIFHFNTTHMLPWNETQEYCKQRGMRMTLLKSFYEVQLVAQQIKLRAADDKFGYWLSATTIGQASPQKFLWTDGTPLDKSAWASCCPSLSVGGKDSCVYFHTVDAKYRNWNCADVARILCVMPLTQCA